MQLKSQGHNFSSRSADALVYSLWSLLPSFCNYPSDTAESFNDLKKALCGALRCKPQIRGIVCLSLQILVQQNKKFPEEGNDLSDSEVGSAKKRAMANYTHQVTADNLSVLKSRAHEILTVLSDVFLETTEDDGGRHTEDDGGCLQVLKYVIDGGLLTSMPLGTDLKIDMCLYIRVLLITINLLNLQSM